MVKSVGFKVITNEAGAGSTSHIVDGGHLAAVALGNYTDPGGEVNTPSIQVGSVVNTKGDHSDSLGAEIYNDTVNLGDIDCNLSGSLIVLGGETVVTLTGGSPETEYHVTLWIND